MGLLFATHNPRPDCSLLTLLFAQQRTEASMKKLTIKLLDPCFTFQALNSGKWLRLLVVVCERD